MTTGKYNFLCASCTLRDTLYFGFLLIDNEDDDVVEGDDGDDDDDDDDDINRSYNFLDILYPL